MTVFQTISVIEGNPALSSGQKKLQEAQQILMAALQLPIYKSLKLSQDQLTNLINGMVTVLNVFIK